MSPVSNSTLPLPPAVARSKSLKNSIDVSSETTQKIVETIQDSLVRSNITDFDPLMPHRGEIIDSVTAQHSTTEASASDSDSDDWDTWEDCDIEASLTKLNIASEKNREPEEIEEDLADTEAMISLSPQKRLSICRIQLNNLQQSIKKDGTSLSNIKNSESLLRTKLRYLPRTRFGLGPKRSKELKSQATLRDSEYASLDPSEGNEKIRVVSEKYLRMEQRKKPPREARAAPSGRNNTSSGISEKRAIKQNIKKNQVAIEKLLERIKEQKTEESELVRRIAELEKKIATTNP